MTQKEKQLLLRVLCTLMPYGVKVKISRRRDPVTLSLNIMTDFYLGCSVKPYLRPMSSMTEEEKDTFQGFIFPACNDPVSMIDWLNAHHFDYRGLIEKGLALEAQEGMYNTKIE